MVLASSSVVAMAGSGGRVARAAVRTAVRVGGRAALTALPHTGWRRGHPGAPSPVLPEAVSFVDARAEGLPPITVAYERSGAGEPVVLLHGLGLNRRTWDPVLPYLTGEREVIAIDLPGFGRSPDLPAGLSRDLPTTARLLEVVFTALGVARPHVVGHSLGGLIALRLGQDDLVRGVTAIAPAGFWTESERRRAFTVLTAARNIARTVPGVAVERLAATPAGRAVMAGMLYGDALRCPPGIVASCMRALHEATGFEATLLAGRTPGLFTGPINGVPVTLVWGTADRLLPPRQAWRALATVPRARLVWVPGGGHMPMNDAPDLLAEVILRATRPDAAASVA